MKLKLIVKDLSEVDAKFHSLYEEKDGEFHLVGVEGMKTQADVDRVQKALQAERDAHKRTKQVFSALDGMDIEDVVSRLDRFDELEAAAAASKDPKKVDELVEARLASKTRPLERQVSELTKQLTEAKSAVESLTAERTVRTVHDAVRVAADKLKMLPSAIEDAQMLAERHLVVTEDGSVRVKEGSPYGEGLDAEGFFNELRTNRAHWWPASHGGGAVGSGNGTGGGVNPWSKAGWNMTKQGQIFKERGAEVAKRMAESAGTTIGGPIPEK